MKKNWILITKNIFNNDKNDYGILKIKLKRKNKNKLFFCTTGF